MLDKSNMRISTAKLLGGLVISTNDANLVSCLDYFRKYTSGKVTTGAQGQLNAS
jgi:hypothetical protein